MQYITTYFRNNEQRRADSHYQVKQRLQPFVLLVECLLVSYAQNGKYPNKPFHRGRPAVRGKLLDREPRKIRTRDKYVNHRSVAAVKNVPQTPENDLKATGNHEKCVKTHLSLLQ